MKKIICGVLLAAVLFAALAPSAFAADGYNVAIRQDQTRAVGETATVTLEMRAEGYSSFNTLDISLTYPTDLLEYQTISPDDYTVIAKNGTLRVIGYGSAHGLGTVLTLRFAVKAAGTAKVLLSEAKVDQGENALSEDMPAARIVRDTVTITISGAAAAPPGGGGKVPGHDGTDNDGKHETWSVVFTGSGAEDAGGEPTAEDGKDYIFSINREDGYRYDVAGTVRGKAVEVRDNGDGTYTVAGESMHGNLRIDVTKTRTPGVDQADVTVTFDPMNGESTWVVSAEAGSLIAEPGKPERRGYDFTGWYTEPTAGNKWDFSTRKVEHDVTLSAGWAPAGEARGGTEHITEPAPHSEKTKLPAWLLPVVCAAAALGILLLLFALRRKKVSFVSNGVVLQTMRVKKGGKLTMPEIPGSEGHDFVGWYRDETLLKRWSFENDTVNESMKLYAKWH